MGPMKFQIHRNGPPDVFFAFANLPLGYGRVIIGDEFSYLLAPNKQRPELPKMAVDLRHIARAKRNRSPSRSVSPLARQFRRSPELDETETLKKNNKLMISWNEIRVSHT